MKFNFMAICDRLFAICRAANTKLFSVVLLLQLQKDK